MRASGIPTERTLNISDVQTSGMVLGICEEGNLVYSYFHCNIEWAILEKKENQPRAAGNQATVDEHDGIVRGRVMN